jgi:flagellar motor protein MotB
MSPLAGHGLRYASQSRRTLATSAVGSWGRSRLGASARVRRGGRSRSYRSRWNGSGRRFRGRTPGSVRIGLLAAVAAVLVGLLAASGRLPGWPPASTGGSSAVGRPVLLYTAGDGEQSAPHLSDLAREALRATALSNGSVSVLEVDGDGSTRAKDVDLTPRYGEEIDQIAGRRSLAADANVAAIDAELRTSAATVAGRSLLAGFQAAARLPGRRVIYAVSSGLDINDPLDLRRIGWDTPPAHVVAFLRRADELPRLQGRTVVLSLLPATGEQPQLGQPEKDSLAALWVAILQAAGARVSLAPVDALPATATIAVPTVAVPPPATFSDSTCTVAAPALFVYGTADLVNRDSAVGDLRDCAQVAASGRYTISITGHTSQDPGTGPSGGGPLSTARAEAVRDLLVNDLAVPAALITQVRGVGASRPLCSPVDAACNRAVVIQYQPLR